MTVIVGAAPIVAAADRNDENHTPAARALTRLRERLIIPAPVTAEIDYLAVQRGGRFANVPFLDDLAAGRFEVECLTREEYATVARLERQYGGQFGLADLSVVVLAARFRTRRVLTFDERHFRVIAPIQGGAFTLLPWDEA